MSQGQQISGQAVAVTALTVVPAVPGSTHGHSWLRAPRHAEMQDEANPVHQLSLGNSPRRKMTLGSVQGVCSPLGLGLLGRVAWECCRHTGLGTALLG